MTRILFIALLLVSACRTMAAAERLFYLNNGQVLQGCVYKPKGKGPFPVFVFNQNSTKPWPEAGEFDPFPELGKYFTARGYVLFAPGRQKLKDENADEEAAASDPKSDAVERERKSIHSHELHGEIIFSAITTLKAQSYVDPDRIFAAGQAAGGTTTLLMSGKDLNVRGFVLFSAASGVWGRSPILQNEMKRAVRNAKAPILLIQPQNDMSLAPAEILGKELQKKGPPNAVKISPPYGKTGKESTNMGMRAPEIWGDDVFLFFGKCLEQ